jgi:ABC-type transporter Mla subunit MlaD
LPKKPSSSRVPSAVGAIPVVGDLVRSADQQARWMQEMLEQNARLVGQLPATLKSFNDALERFNQTVGRLDAAVTRIEAASRLLSGPLEKATSVLDPQALREIPETLETLRRETVPALRAAVDTQRQVAALQGTIDRFVTVLAELPGAGMLRRRTSGRPTPEPPADR